MTRCTVTRPLDESRGVASVFWEDCRIGSASGVDPMRLRLCQGRIALFQGAAGRGHSDGAPDLEVDAANPDAERLDCRDLGMSTPFTPENIVEGPDGRWYHDDLDVTDHPLDWWCADGHTWMATLAARTAPGDAGCPTCYLAEHPLDAADVAYDVVDLPEFAAALRTVCQSVTGGNLSRNDRVALAKVAYTELLDHLSALDVLIALAALDEHEAMTVLHDHFAVGLTGR